ncbi:BgtASP-20287 [Blumeria graminis f. sp. tritici]|uniref:BgtASP-20287 n=2 Tax=Blumeria graminis f. sp. tritici TaxID=62690 RepID=A0A9X9PQP3_BLUGR|nr:hypothetical protein BGT96224_ASP20287 [Blumeria graminis f. sp. tritici 96224]VCU38945.1 BgtASP-20287 [Blumeria graminis f. sp. tritici]
MIPHSLHSFLVLFLLKSAFYSLSAYASPVDSPAPPVDPPSPAPVDPVPAGPPAPGPTDPLADTIPPFALDFAPLVWLDKKETFFPSDIETHISNTSPFIDLKIVETPLPPLSTANLDVLNPLNTDTQHVFLTTKVPVQDSPKWLEGVAPDQDGKSKDATTCVTIISNRGNGTVDVFYMYFYSFNKGTDVLFHELGNHVGDWEHNMIRFQNGEPDGIWFSQHSNGQAFRYQAVEKQGKRPVVYSARGSHANYAIDGNHDHSIPNINLPAGPVTDRTSQGTLWDPVKSSFFYTYDGATNSIAPLNNSPLGFMKYNGLWGNTDMPKDDPAQESLFGFPKFVGGPSGPMDKRLNRINVCLNDDKSCKVRDKLAA